MPTPLGFPTPPDSTVLAAVYNWLRQLATAIDAFLTGAGPTNCTMATSPSVVTAVVSGVKVRRRGSIVVLGIELQPQGVTFPADTALFTIPTGYRPDRAMRGLIHDAAGTARLVTINPTGTVTCSSGLGAGVSMYGSITYSIA